MLVFNCNTGSRQDRTLKQVLYGIKSTRYLDPGHRALLVLDALFRLKYQGSIFKQSITDIDHLMRYNTNMQQV